MADFSTMLKYLRQREGLSQRQLASKLKMSASAIGMYESGKRIPRHEDEEAIADFFNVDLNTLRGIRVNENYLETHISNEDQALLDRLHKISPETRNSIELLIEGDLRKHGLQD